jgi:hypothetical protein
VVEGGDDAAAAVFLVGDEAVLLPVLPRPAYML